MTDNVERNPLGSVEPEANIAGQATKAENAKNTTESEATEHTTEPGTKISGEQGSSLGITPISALDSTTQGTFNNALDISGQMTMKAIDQDDSDVTNSFGMARSIPEPMVAKFMEHQDEDTKPGSSGASVPADRTLSGITLTHMMGRRKETNTLSVPSVISDDNGIELEDALQPLDNMDRNGELFPGTPMAIDEDEEAHGIPGVKTPTLSPDSGNVAQNAQILELTGPAVNRGSSGTQPAQTPMGGDLAVDEDYGDFGAGHHLPHPSTVHMNIKEDDPLCPEDSVSNKGQSAGSPMALDSVSNNGQSAGSPMALDSEVEEDIGDSRAGTKMPQLTALRQGWSGFNQGSDERSSPASRKRDRENSEEEEDGDDKEAMKRMKRMKRFTEQTNVAHGDYHHSPSGYQLQNAVSGQGAGSQGVVSQAPSQQDDDTLDIF